MTDRLRATLRRLPLLLAALLPHSVAGAEAAGLLIVAAGLAGGRARDAAGWKYPALFWLGALAALAALRGGHSSPFSALRAVWPLLVVYAAVPLLRDDAARGRVMRVYWASLGLLVTVYWVHLALEARAVAQGAPGGGLWAVGEYRYGFLRSRSVAGTQLALGALAAAAYGRWSWFAFLSLGLFSIEARAGALAWVAGAIVAVGLRRIPLRWAVGVFVLSFTLLTLRHVAQGRPLWIERWRLGDVAEDSSLSQRLLFWKIAREEWLASPRSALLGNGWGAFFVNEEKFPPEFRSLAGGREPGHPHNSYLQLLHASGVAGLVLFLAGWGFVARRAVEARASPAGLAGLLALVALAVSGAADKTLLSPMTMLPGSLLLAIHLAQDDIDRA